MAEAATRVSVARAVLDELRTVMEREQLIPRPARTQTRHSV
jgi:hypothetical protein